MVGIIRLRFNGCRDNERDRRARQIEIVCRCDWSSDIFRVELSQSGFSRPQPPPLSPPTICVVSRRAAVLIICVAVNEKDVCICTSRLSVDFHRRFVANVSHGY
jgi:hypothetical protein